MFQNCVKNNQGLSNRRALSPMFLHMNHITIHLHNHLFGIKISPHDKDLHHLIIETDILSLSTIGLDLSPQTIVTLFSTIHRIPTFNRALIFLHNKTRPMSFEIPHAHLLHLLYLFRL